MKTSAYTKWQREFIENAKTTNTPVVGMYELTSRCNLDCKMCYVHNQDNQLVLSQELTTEQWKSIFDQAYQNGLFFATLTGGECLLRSDFKELYLYLWKKGIKVSILTNGTMINEEYLQFFKQFPPDFIQISLYGSDDAHYYNVAGHHMYEKAAWAIKQLVESKIDVRVAVTASRYLQDDYIKILKYCKQNGYTLANIEMFLFPNRDNPEKNDYYLTEDEIVSLCKERALLFGQNLEVRVDVPETGKACGKSPLNGTTCTAGNCRAFVSWEGKMYPCANMMIGGYDVLAEGYEAAWRKTAAIAKTVVNAAECVDCAYKEICPKCPAMRLTDFFDGHCNKATCYITREKFRSGIYNHL